METSHYETLRKGLVNARADLMAYRMLMHALIISMPPAARTNLLKNLADQNSQALAVARSPTHAADTASIDAMQAAVDRVAIAIRALPIATSIL